MFKYGTANRYDAPRSLDMGTGMPTARDQFGRWDSGSSMWKPDTGRSPVNWLHARQNATSTIESSAPPPPSSIRHHLLALPTEVRELILQYTLPQAISYRNSTAWLRGSVAILRTNRQLHSEGRRILYSLNKFTLEVLYDCTVFSMLWIHTYGARTLHVRRQRAFDESIAPANRRLMRYVDVTVRHVDSYTGMVKYGYGGGGLVEGLRTQVVFLMQSLRAMDVVAGLEVCLHCEDQSQRAREEAQVVLEPFFALRNVRVVKRVSGHVEGEMARRLREGLPEARRRAVMEPDCEDTEENGEAAMKVSRPPNLESHGKKGLAVYRGYDDREI